MGVFVLLIIALSFAAGAIKREMVLTLTGAIFLAIWSYCLFMTLLLALLHFRRAKRVSIRLSPEKNITGGKTHVLYLEDKKIPEKINILQFPGILVRCRTPLQTKDGRRFNYDFIPGDTDSFFLNKRGAYFSDYDEFAVFDILGFFRFAYRIPVSIESGARLLAGPYAASDSIPVKARGGDSNRHDSSSLERTDYLIDHRPYVPGDDPRRINWKLYGHCGELIIRQGEREPPPHSNITILIDSQFDELYESKSAARRAVDLLCENALAIINNASKEVDIQIGYLGQTEAVPVEPGFALAYPAAIYEAAALQAARLPVVPEERAVVILSLPKSLNLPRTTRTGTNSTNREEGKKYNTALECFVSENANRLIELLFVYDAGKKEQEEAARECAALYNKRPGVRAQAVGVEK
jgi:hypothetical protein